MEHILKNNHDHCTVVILCPGLTAEDIKVNADIKENTLAVLGKASKSVVEEYEDVELNFEGLIQIGKSFGVARATKTVENGILKITVPTSKDIKEI